MLNLRGPLPVRSHVPNSSLSRLPFTAADLAYGMTPEQQRILDALSAAENELGPITAAPAASFTPHALPRVWRSAYVRSLAVV